MYVHNVCTYIYIIALYCHWGGGGVNVKNTLCYLCGVVLLLLLVTVIIVWLEEHIATVKLAMSFSSLSGFWIFIEGPKIRFLPYCSIVLQ